MNELLTAYLRTLYAVRGGRLTAAEAMNHIVDLLSTAQTAMAAFGKLTSLGGLGAGERARKQESGSEQHA